MSVQLRPVTDAVRDHLSDALGVPVEVGDRTVDPPSVVVHPLPGGSWDRMLDDSWDAVAVPYQVTCVGVGREQAEELADDVRAALLESPLGGVRRVRPDDGRINDVRVHRDVTPHVWVATPVYYMTLA